MAMSDKQFVAMVFNPALKFGETIPKIEGRPWDEDIGRLRNYVMRRMPQATIAYLWERVQVLDGALRFYADPFKYTDIHGDDVRVPHFYSETDFGETARVALGLDKPWSLQP